MLRRAIILWAAVLCGGGAFAPLFAQQPKTPPDVTRDTDRDGVPDNRDRCPGTPAGVRVDVNGCPLAAPPQPAPSAAPAVSSAPAAAPGAITQQAAQPGAAKPTPPPTTSGAAPSGAQPVATTQPAATQPSGAPPAGSKPAGAPPAGASPSAAPPSAAAPVGAPVVVPPAPSPIAIGAAGQPSVQPSGAAAANARPAGAAPAGAAPSAAAPVGAPAAGSPPPHAAPAAPAASAATADATLTEGFLMRGWVPNSGRPTLEYVRDFALKLDSAAQTLRNIFSTASGQPVAGATDPTKLVTREKLRWRRCRNVKEDIQTFADNVPLLEDSLPATMREQWTTLGERFDSLQSVLENCETIAFMIESPERYTPWQTNYETSARAFYADWYSRLRALHEAMRQVARLVAAQLPATADRRQALQMIPPMSPIPPTPGGH